MSVMIVTMLRPTKWKLFATFVIVFFMTAALMNGWIEVFGSPIYLPSKWENAYITLSIVLFWPLMLWYTLYFQLYYSWETARMLENAFPTADSFLYFLMLTGIFFNIPYWYALVCVGSSIFSRLMRGLTSGQAS